MIALTFSESSGASLGSEIDEDILYMICKWLLTDIVANIRTWWSNLPSEACCYYWSMNILKDFQIRERLVTEK